MIDPWFFKTRRKVLLAAASGLVMPKLLSAEPKAYGIVGQLAPELKITHWIDVEGNPGEFTLANHRGKYVFLECWQSWCPGCHSHGFPTLKKIYAALKDSDYFIAVGIQTTFEGYASNMPDKMREMQNRYDLPIIMGHDAGDQAKHTYPTTMQNYRTGGTPWAILISPDGYVLYNDFGLDGDNAIAYLKAGIEKITA